MSASVSYGALTLSRHCSLNSRLMSEDPAARAARSSIQHTTVCTALKNVTLPLDSTRHITSRPIRNSTLVPTRLLCSALVTDAFICTLLNFICLHVLLQLPSALGERLR